MIKEELIESIKNAKGVNARNSMGCNESWYSSYYAIKNTFSLEEIEAMTEKELNNLVRLGDAMSEAFY